MAVRDVRKADHFFLLSALILVVFGLIMLASASAPVGYAKFGDTYFFVKKQLLFGLLPGIILFTLFGHLDYHSWKKFSWVMYFLAVAFLIAVFIPGVGAVINGARNWVRLSNFSFQPSEFAKLALVIILAKLLAESGELDEWKRGLLPILSIVAPIILLVALQDIGTLSILLMIIFVMLFLARVRRTHLFVLGILGAAAFFALLLVAPYRVERLTTFLHPELDPKGVGYQINQAFLAVGSGGVWGLGLGHSRQKFQYLPETQADSIFAVIAEEMGFIISTAFVFLILFFGLRGFKIAKAAPDEFGRLLVGGIMIWFMWQFFLNISAIIGVLPLTGVPLPFVSHGGSALLVALLAVGIVANVSRYKVSNRN